VAAIPLIGIAVIALLARIDNSIAADGDLAIALTAVAIDDVAIVALLDSCEQESVAALSDVAAADTPIGVGEVAVVALLLPQPDKSVPTLGRQAQDASIRGAAVPVVTKLARLDGAVAAGARATVVLASVVVVSVPVVTKLVAHPDETVSAEGRLAEDAVVIRAVVGVVACLDA
jgi:hypothetical protein